MGRKLTSNTQSAIKPVPFDPELTDSPLFLRGPWPHQLSPEEIVAMRERIAAERPSMESLLEGRAVTYEERTVPGPEGAPDVLVGIYRPTATQAAHPGIYWIHGGGMMLGRHTDAAAELIEAAERFGTVGVSVDYRRAPETPDPGPREDCYAGLVWMAENATELGVDPDRILIWGPSAGAGLTAGVTLMARDRGGPKLIGQLLNSPMIDDRDQTLSTHQYDGSGTWDRTMNLTGWSALLGERRGTDEVSPYAAPARCEDLSNLPPTFIEVGAAEPFRDEAIEYANRIWAVGGDAELHVWRGAYHGYNVYAPEARVSVITEQARFSWLDRIINAR